MSDFQTRLLTEKKELDEKRYKLDEFMNSGRMEQIDPVQKSLLLIQHSTMRAYSDCLGERIMWLEKAGPPTSPA